MINSGKVRAWSTPLTIGAFALSATTGIMVFFHLGSGLARVLHEWFSWLLVIGGVFHVTGSWLPFVRYFSRPAGKAIMGLFAVLIVISFLPLHGEHGDAVQAHEVAGSLAHLPFATVASVACHQPEELIKELRSKGFVVDRKEDTIQKIATRNNRQNVEILNAIF